MLKCSMCLQHTSTYNDMIRTIKNKFNKSFVRFVRKKKQKCKEKEEKFGELDVGVLRFYN